MEYRNLGKSGLKVSEIGLGCSSATFAGRADEQTSINIISHALELGINYIDTAETYAEGRSKQLVGKAVKGKRSQVIIGTKFGKDRSVGPSEQRGSRNHLIKAVEGSLSRLGTDYIDLYIMHEPGPKTSIEETLRTLDELVQAGKVRYIGCSEFAAWQLCDALWNSKAHHLQSFVVAGAEYNLINRSIERELVPCCQTFGIGIVPTFPLAGGFLTGKYRRGRNMPSGSRFGTVPVFANAIHQDLSRHNYRLTDSNFEKLDLLEAFARERGRTVGELAIAWSLWHGWLSSVIIGVTSIEQITLNLSAVDWKLTEDEIAILEKIV
jgi:aryl-alcohol dehydrogenase-like predicted oxidoreductase